MRGLGQPPKGGVDLWLLEFADGRQFQYLELSGSGPALEVRRD
jgi:hypothetical protein